MIRILVVDDEPPARRRIRSLLAKDGEVTVVGECANGVDAIDAIRCLAPDLIFLDVQMPELDGFGVLQAIERHKMPAVVFVTAYDRYAVEAFTARALDFLLKPFNRERFQESLSRAKKLIGSKDEKQATDRLLELLEHIRQEPACISPLIVKTDGRHVFLDPAEVGWIEASGDYVHLHAGKRSYLIREKMQAIETRLNPRKFIRIHRSTIVNMDFIKEVHPGIGGDYLLRLKDQTTTLTVSRSHRIDIQRLLKEAL